MTRTLTSTLRAAGSGRLSATLEGQGVRAARATSQWETRIATRARLIRRLAPAASRHAEEEIPILDLAPYLAGRPSALEQLAGELRHALEHIGFYFIRGHGVPAALSGRE